MFQKATFKDDGMLTINNADFLSDPRFVQSFAAALDSIPENIVKDTLGVLRWRAHVCCWAANQAKHLEGDFVECGVWYGVLSRALAEYVDFDKSDKTFYLLDPWGGLQMGNSSDYQPDIYDVVKSRFSKYSNVRMIRGLVPETLLQVPSQKVAFLSIDMNGIEPERQALNYFYDKMVPGGVIYFDDYGVAGYEGLKAMVDEFFKNKPESIMYIPTGQGIVVKL